MINKTRYNSNEGHYPEPEESIKKRIDWFIDTAEKLQCNWEQTRSDNPKNSSNWIRFRHVLGEQYDTEYALVIYLDMSDDQFYTTIGNYLIKVGKLIKAKELRNILNMQ